MSASPEPYSHTQRIFAIVSNVSFGVEQSCVLVIKPRRKDPDTASLLSVIPILPDLKIEIEPQQGLTASAATPRNHPPAATTLGISSLPQSLPTIHTLLESVVPDLFASDKADTSNAALNSPCLMALRQRQAASHPPPPRPASPTQNDIRISLGTFNVNGQLPSDDIPTIIGLKKWLRAEQEPDLIVLGFQEVDTSSGAYLYYSPAREDAWTRSITQALGRRADKYRKIAAKQLVGLMILVFVRTDLEADVSEGLQAMERRCWDWNEIYKRLRFRLTQPKMEDFWESPATAAQIREVEINRGSDLGDSSKEQPTNPFKTAHDAEEEASSENGRQEGVEQELQEAVSSGKQAKDDNGLIDNKQPPHAFSSDAAPSRNGITTNAAEFSTLPVSPKPTSPPPGVPLPPSTSYTEHPIMEHDIILHLGDLNFRLDLSHSEAHRLIRSRQYELLYRYDQLESLRTSGSLFDDFEEGKIDFAPTYKFDKGTDRYDTSEKQRVPAWTDRVLWSVTREWEDTAGSGESATSEVKGSGKGDGKREEDGDEEGEKQGQKRRRQGVVLQAYESIPDLKFSDHRPVRATFLVRVR
ncbi:related to INP52 - phosphatidylinositol phosphate phosphatase [Ustilago trichophora]|uniref:Related to INP52 - phosphatidylinositol phosphate phosphatase n=1 Tax=Ustilago trichophora TaxID=86804 RepID=A0A5C3E7G9_9BASI|nr:related to INP52 - phosphatidylinositol phosphate phosphatase [Ustilago trichophora]